MANELIWAGVTIAQEGDYHFAGEDPSSANYENIIYPGAAGRVIRVTGSEQTSDSSRTITFAPGNNRPNYIVGVDMNAVLSIVQSVENAFKTSPVGALTAYTRTGYLITGDWELLDFSTDGEVFQAGGAPAASLYRLNFTMSLAKVAS